MTHVFLIHSSTTLIVAKGVIEKENIDSKDVFFLLTRGFTTNLNYRKISCNYFFQKLENLKYSNFYKGWSLINEIDDFVEDIISDIFTIYLPHIAHPFFQILSTNDKCLSVNILEEGVNCLSKKLYDNKSSLKFQIINFIFNKSKLYGKGRYFRVRSNIDFPLFQKIHLPIFYSITPNGFLHVKDYMKINVPYNFIDLKNEKDFIEENSLIFVFEAILEQGNLSSQTFFNSILQSIEGINSDKIYVKFHPAQNKENIEKICDILSTKFEIICLNRSVILEFEFLRCKKLIVLGFTTSLLHYAKLFGHQIISYSSLWEKDELFSNFRLINDFPIPSN
jgi:hypothetical protein